MHNFTNSTYIKVAKYNEVLIEANFSFWLPNLIMSIIIMGLYIWLVYNLREKMSKRNMITILIYNITIAVKIVALSIFYWDTSDQGQAYIEISSNSKFVLRDFALIYRIRLFDDVLDYVFIMLEYQILIELQRFWDYLMIN